MSVEAIRERILSEAEREAGQIVAEAEEERRAREEEHAAELREQYSRELERLQSKAMEKRRMGSTHVHREAERKLQSARRRMIDDAIDGAVDRLASLPDDRYLPIIGAILDRCDLEGDVEVVISPDDEGRVTQRFLEGHSDGDRKLVLSEERHDLGGGVIMRAGSISQNGTFAMLATLAHDDLVMALAEMVPVEIG